jgi:hypothetical protein
LTACQTDAGEDDGPWNPKVVKAADLQQELTKMPLAPYRLTGAENATYFRAIELLMKRCLDRFSVTATVKTAQEWKQFADTTDAQDLVGIGLVNESVASTKGYQNTLPVQPPAGAPGAEEVQLSRGTVSVYNGVAVPKGGCRGEATATLHGEASKLEIGWATLQANGTSTKARTDRRFADMVAEWRACMDNAGYDYSSPQQAAEKFGAQAVSEAQIKTATADVRCKEKVNYLGVYLTVWAKYQQQSLDQNVATYAELLTFKKQVLQKAVEVLGS